MAKEFLPFIGIVPIFPPDALERNDPELRVKKRVAQRHRAMGLLDHGDGGCADLAHPRGQLPDIGHRGAEAHEPYFRGGEDDALLPYRPPFRVIEVVDLVENRIVHIHQARRLFKDQVPEDLGGHDEQPGVRIDRNVAGLDTHRLIAETPAKVPVLLVGERFNGCGVDHAPAQPHGGVHRIFSDERLPAPGRRGDDEGLAAINGFKRLLLKRVQFQVQVVHDRPPPRKGRMHHAE